MKPDLEKQLIVFSACLSSSQQKNNHTDFSIYVLQNQAAASCIRCSCVLVLMTRHCSFDDAVTWLYNVVLLDVSELERMRNEAIVVWCVAPPRSFAGIAQDYRWFRQDSDRTATEYESKALPVVPALLDSVLCGYAWLCLCCLAAFWMIQIFWGEHSLLK